MSSVLDLDSVSVNDARVGGKARNLARLRAAGLPCPKGVVVPADALAQPGWRQGLEEACRQLRAPLAVRSSASIEDLSAGAAPGLFDSILEVEHGGLAAAIDRVLASARSDAVKSYCLLAGIDPSSVAMSVVIQEQVEDVLAAGVLYTRPPSRPHADTLMVDIEHSTDGPWAGERPRDGGGEAVPLPARAWSELVRHALAAEEAIDAPTGADVEWVIDTDAKVWLAQARPIVHGEETRTAPAHLFEHSEGDSREWTWDVTHNPDPLSPAQAGLVELVAGVGAGVEMQVVGGYLYTAPSQTPVSPVAVPESPGAITRFFTDEIVPAVDAELGALERDEAPDLERSLSAYQSVVSLYARRVAPTLRAGREPLRRFLVEHFPDESTSQLMTALLATRSDRHLAARIRRVAGGGESIESLLAYAAPMAAAWDVAAPTFAEDPSPILEAVAAERERSDRERPDDTREADAQAVRLRARLQPDQQGELDRVLARAREAHELGETDDHVFFRAQAVVRRALLATARRWDVEEPSDIFYLELDRVREHADRGCPEGFSREVEEARAVRDKQSATSMPLSFRAGRPRRPRSRGAGFGWRGIGCGGRARGRVLKLRDLGSLSEPARGRVILARSLSPSLLFQVAGAAALVSIYGGPLGHGAAMARELGLACVVQCHGAWEALADGDDVWVDGEAGLVVPAGTN